MRFQSGLSLFFFDFFGFGCFGSCDLSADFITFFLFSAFFAAGFLSPPAEDLL